MAAQTVAGANVGLWEPGVGDPLRVGEPAVRGAWERRVGVWPAQLGLDGEACLWEGKL